MTMDVSSHKKMLYMGGNVLYIAGWAITLIGLALVQDECKEMLDNGDLTGAAFGGIPFFTSPVGDDCKKGFRYACGVWT